MTRVECDICMRKSFPVHVTENAPQKDFMTDKFYKIISAHKCKNKHDRNWKYSFGVAPGSNPWRESYTVLPEYLIVDSEYDQLLKAEIEETLFKSIKAYINELIAAGVEENKAKEKIAEMFSDDKPKKRKSKEEIEEFSKKVEEIIGYLNEKLGTHYKTSSKTTRELIQARLNEGYTVDDFKKVINNQCIGWKGNNMAQYLRPRTLFSNKFEDYLNVKYHGSQGLVIDSTYDIDEIQRKAMFNENYDI